MNIYRLWALVLLSSSSVAHAAPDDAAARLQKARSLKCVFGPGSMAEWKDGVLAVSSGRFAPPGEPSTIRYHSIDPSTRKARVSGAVGSSDMDLVVGKVGVTLVESVEAGGLVITTIYGSYDAKRAFPAVMSKHLDVVGPFPQQYYGNCVVSE